jgi:hypothetical protein
MTAINMFMLEEEEKDLREEEEERPWKRRKIMRRERPWTNLCQRAQ